MKRLNIMVGLVLFISFNGFANLQLVIDLSSQTFDWVDGTGITRTFGTDNNRFGNLESDDAIISSPLLGYSGNGIHYGASFDISADSTAIQGIGLSTTYPPGHPASFYGTAQGPTTPVFSMGSFSEFENLSLGTYTLAPVIAGWDGGIMVTIIPEPATMALLALGGCALLRKRK